jgi:carboxylesterase
MKVIHRNARPFFYEGNKEISCLLIHGFTGSPADMRPLGAYLQKKGYGVSGILLPGHGTIPRDLAQTDWAQWYKAVEDEYLRLRKRYKLIIPMGLSLGGILALYLSVKHEVKGLVSLSAPVFFRDERAYDVVETDLEYFSKNRTSEEKKRNLAKGRFSYEEIPIPAFASLIEFIDMVKEELAEIKASSLVIQSLDDPLVNPQSAQYLYGHLGSMQKKLVWLEKSKHVITLGAERQQVFEAIKLFLQEGTKERFLRQSKLSKS